MAGAPESCCSAVTLAPGERTPRLLAALLVLTKPGIVLAEAATGLTGLLLAAPGWPAATASVFCCLLALIMAASGAAMANCVLDADADQRMPRLAARSRALAAVGKARALVLALLLMIAACTLAALTLNLLTVALLALACASYLLFYTLWLKRSSPWGVLAGALPGALPALIGAAAVSGTIASLPLLLGAMVALWQLPHFGFLSLHFQDDYRQAGVPVLPLVYGVAATGRLILLSAASLLPLSLAFCLLAHASPLATGIVLLAGALFLWHCYRCLDGRPAYRRGFLASLLYLAVVLVATSLEMLL